MKNFLFIKLILVTCLLECTYAVQAAPASLQDGNGQFVKSKIGTCESEGQKIDLLNVYFLKNTFIKAEKNEGYDIYEISGDTFYIKHFGTDNKLIFTLPFYMTLELNSLIKSLGDVDVILEFVLVKGQPALYWKESFLHKPYRQGILKIENNSLAVLCIGKAGTRTDH